jgi:hypothetical protein
VSRKLRHSGQTPTVCTSSESSAHVRLVLAPTHNAAWAAVGCGVTSDCSRVSSSELAAWKNILTVPSPARQAIPIVLSYVRIRHSRLHLHADACSTYFPSSDQLLDAIFAVAYTRPGPIVQSYAGFCDRLCCSEMLQPPSDNDALKVDANHNDRPPVPHRCRLQAN